MKRTFLLLAAFTIAFSCAKKKDDPQPATNTTTTTPTPSTPTTPPIVWTCSGSTFLKIKNTTSSTQTTYLDNVKIKDLAGNDSTSVTVNYGQTYLVKFVFKDFPSITPTVDTIKIECGKNNVVTF